MKKFSIPCDFNGVQSPFTIYIGDPEPKHHPLHFQADWLSRERGGTIPANVMDSVAKLKDLSEKNNVSFEELCVYALGAAQQQESEEASEENDENAEEELGEEDTDAPEETLDELSDESLEDSEELTDELLETPEGESDESLENLDETSDELGEEYLETSEETIDENNEIKDETKSDKPTSGG
ncbi:hypothetical protein SZ25_00514 [Candidatus Arcanobacter lacustris]|uniref:DUF2610 domain-containing protein n=1 Tax=Candidatus Arcanibacter lacustris TaxID=1607817 RepID=A0A0F5MP77_9RICK|nr:hypothetical protein SZ25_00514 [Candidatus Arcanobacter lacustris]